MSDADEIDYEIGGSDIQYVEIELDPGESVVSEAGAMMYKAPSIGMEAVFGDGSQKNKGVWGALAGAGKR
ncbi:AIM24 family protein, partial [Maricaulis maris]|uniref:AIM24 family protein n=2 Tax=Maricaulis TaxID=74317 RepID=UPI003BA8696C